MYHLHEEAIVMEKQEVSHTLVRDYYLNLVELMRAPCEQVIMKDLSPGALQEIHRLRWIVRLGLVRHEFYLSIDAKVLCIMGWRQICNELNELRYMCENDIPMYRMEARPTPAALSEYAAALSDPIEAATIQLALYDENDKRNIWSLHSAVADLDDDLPELCRDTWHLANSLQADDDDRQEYQRAMARYRTKYKRKYDSSVHGQTG